MRLLRWLPIVAVSAVTACSSLLGIHDPEIERLGGGGPTVEGGNVDEAGNPIDGGPNPEGGVDSGLVCAKHRGNCNTLLEDGCETDLTTPANCGSCDHVCLACSNGQCAPQTVATGGGLDYAGFISVDDKAAGFVYWASEGSKGLYATAKSNGTPVLKVGSDPFDATSIYVGASYVGATVYTIAEGVRMYDPTSQAAYTGIQLDACNRALGLVADETGAVYYAHASQVPGTCGMATIDITKRTPSGGGAFQQPWTFEAGGYRAGESEWLALDANFLYFVGYRNTAAGIFRIGRGGGASAMVAPGNFNSAPLAVDATSIYTLLANDTAAAELVAYDKLTGVKTILATGERSFAPSAVANSARKAQLVIDATHVYWTAADDTGSPTALGRIMRIPKAGGAKEILADKQTGAYGVAIDATFVYWTTATAIKRVPK